MANLKSTYKINRILLILYVVFIPINLIDIAISFWYDYIFNLKYMSNSNLYLNNVIVLEISRYLRPIHGILNIASTVLLIIWFNRVITFLKALNPDYRINRTMTFIAWIIPIYNTIYIYYIWNKIIGFGDAKDPISKRMRYANLGYFIVNLTSSLVLITNLVYSLNYPSDQHGNYIFLISCGFCSLGVTLFGLIFFKSYPAFETKLVKRNNELHVFESSVLDL